MDQPPKDVPKDKKPVAEFFQHLWGQALVTVSSAEDEATRLLGRVEGAAGWSPDEARRQVREFTERLTTQRRDVEKLVDESLKQAVSRLRIPRREELLQLTTRLESLNRRIEALSK